MAVALPDLSPEDPVAVKTGQAIPAQRCAECHGVIEKQWRGSAHARAAVEPLFLALRKKAPASTQCDRCHRPLAAHFSADEAPLDEGVTCDVCHSMRSALPSRTLSPLPLHLEDNVKYGPLCDAKDHYFHRMGCSPLHAEAKFCGACHLWWQHDLPIFNEYEEWQAGPLAAEGMVCQGCHMPAKRGEIAVGAGARDQVHSHGFLGRDADLRQRALAGQVTVAAGADGALAVTVQLMNRGAGHSVPTGLPERRVILRVRSLDAAGAELESKEVRYGRVLVDKNGALAPFFAAVKVASDTRIAPREQREESLILRAPQQKGRVSVEVRWLAFDPELAEELSLPRTREVVMLRGDIPFGAKLSGLPRTIQVKR